MNEYKYSIASRMDIFYKCEQSFMLEQCSLTYNIHPSKRDVTHTNQTIRNKDEKLERKGEATFDTPIYDKGGFFSESAMRFLDLQISKKNIPKSCPELEI